IRYNQLIESSFYALLVLSDAIFLCFYSFRLLCEYSCAVRSSGRIKCMR
uniref:Uncharacterized protein n=1 Tax=Parascaris univalens TaxID=6257 RepID=A0A915C047_PARUN